MARGSLKSDVAALKLPYNQEFTDFDAMVKASNPTGILGGGEITKLILESGKYPEVFAATKYFIHSLVSYTAGYYSDYKDHKAIKGLMVERFFQLPKSIQEQLSQTGAYEMYRGGNHPVRPDSSGMINASFSRKQGVAESFGNKLYTLDDVESHGPIILVHRVRELAMNIEKTGAAGKSGFKFDEGTIEEGERIVTNIKWKPNLS